MKRGWVAGFKDYLVAFDGYTEMLLVVSARCAEEAAVAAHLFVGLPVLGVTSVESADAVIADEKGLKDLNSTGFDDE